MTAFIFNLFESDRSNAALEMFLMLLIAFLLGYLLSWLIGRNRVIGLEDKIRSNRDKLGMLSGLEAERDELLGDKEKLAEDLKNARNSSSSDLQKMRDEKGRLQKELDDTRHSMKDMYAEEEVMALRRKITEMENAAPTVIETPAESSADQSEEVNKLRSEIQALKAQNRVLADQSKGGNVDLEGMVPVVELDKLRLRLNDLEKQNERLRSSSRGPSPEVHRLRLENEELSIQKDSFLSEKLRLEAELAALQGGAVKKAPVKKEVKKQADKAEKASANESKAEKKPAAKKKAKPEDLSSIVHTLSVAEANESDKDDLKRISGVGPFIEKKLNAIGIYTFEQIASFNSDDIQKVTDAIQFFPGRIQRDDWVSQGKEFSAEK